MVYQALLPLMRTPRLPEVDWTEAPADLNGLVRFAERRNLVSARAPSHFKRSLRPGHAVKEWKSDEERERDSVCVCVCVCVCVVCVCVCVVCVCVCVCVEAVVSGRVLYFGSYYTHCTLVKTCICMRRKYVAYILHCNILHKQPNSINTTEWMGLFKLSWPTLHGDQREGLSCRPALSLV
jgi:hypothetical protein